MNREQNKANNYHGVGEGERKREKREREGKREGEGQFPPRTGERGRETDNVGSRKLSMGSGN